MVVLDMNTKRQRRPNVRLVDIGDMSRSFSGKSFFKPKVDRQRWELEHAEWNNSEALLTSTDTLNCDNLNPNSNDCDLGLDERDRRNPRMGFGMVNRKRRLVKQWRWVNRSWQSSVSLEIGNKFEKGYDDGNFKGHSLSTDSSHSDHGDGEGDHGRNFSDAFGDKTGGSKKTRVVSTTIHGVNEWLKERGFGKYADLFQMHEVDDKALPLLTYEDLREMGISDIGTRRRMYTAIQLLRIGNAASR